MENNVMTMFAILNLLVYTILCTHVWCQLTLCEELGSLQMLFTTKIASIMFVTTRCDLDDKGSHRSTFWSSHCLPTTFQTVWVLGTSRTPLVLAVADPASHQFVITFYRHHFPLP